MKRRFAITLLYILLFQNLSAQEETRAVWVATIGGIDWPRNYARDTQTIDRQKRDFTNMLDRLKQININTILLQTRVRGTVIYPSAYEPWDGCMSGVPGKSPGYDPLRFAIEECHKRGMECFRMQAATTEIPPPYTEDRARWIHESRSHSNS